MVKAGSTHSSLVRPAYFHHRLHESGLSLSHLPPTMMPKAATRSMLYGSCLWAWSHLPMRQCSPWKQYPCGV